MVTEDSAQETGVARGPASDDSASDDSAAPVPSPVVGGPPRFPRRYVYLAVYAALGFVLLLGVGAFLLNRYASTTTASFTSSGSVRSPTAGVPSGKAPPVSSHELRAPLGQFMDISPLKGRTPSGFTLSDARTGAKVSLSSFSGHVVVLTFANARCNDICPVLADELRQAASFLGSTKVPVTFVTINTDPLDTKTGHVPIVDRSQLSSLPGWRFLTGTIRQLNPVWKAYGVAISVDETSRRVSHNDPLYFISPAGKLAWSATVFADESKAGSFTLPANQVARYAEGVARYATKLAAQG